MRSVVRAISPSFLLLAGVFLGGCPVWGPEGGRPVPFPVTDGGAGEGGSTLPDANPPRMCNANTDCATGEYCDPATRTCITSPGCSSNTQCPNGYYCDARNTCIPGCSSDAECSARAAGLVCNMTTRQCRPGGTCAADTDCRTAGEICVGGSCRAPSAVCQFNYQCAAGQECVDGRCLSNCPAAGCPSGQECRGGYCQYPTGGTCNCAANEVCSNNICLRVCAADAECGTGNYCDRGACRVDDRRPPPFCTPPANGCRAGSVCVDGVCRISCAETGTNEECMRRDVNFTRCDAMRICRYFNEDNGQCRRNSDCMNSQQCVNAFCR